VSDPAAERITASAALSRSIVAKDGRHRCHSCAGGS
jgi:hypothetical protein